MRWLAVLLPLAAWGQQSYHVPFTCTPEVFETIQETCTESAPCPVYLDLSSVDARAGRIVISGNLHSERSTLASVLLVSFDGGATWTEPSSRVPQAGLDQMQFFDANTGWVAGEILVGRPRDPFFLLTTDGAKTWRKKFVFDESHRGTIEAFNFDTATKGTVLVDRGSAAENGGRYELCETDSGGDRWEIRQVTAKPPAMRTAIPPPVVWRVRGDAAAKAYRLERSEGGKWVTMTLFPLRVGECKPAEN